MSLRQKVQSQKSNGPQPVQFVDGDKCRFEVICTEHGGALTMIDDGMEPDGTPHNLREVAIRNANMRDPVSGKAVFVVREELKSWASGNGARHSALPFQVLTPELEAYIEESKQLLSKKLASFVPSAAPVTDAIPSKGKK